MTKGAHSTQQANTPLPTSGIRALRVPKPPGVCSLRWLRGTVSLEPTFWRSAGFNESEYSVQETRCSFVCDRRVMVIGTFPSTRLCITSVTNWRGWATLRPSSTLIYVATIAKGSVDHYKRSLQSGESLLRMRTPLSTSSLSILMKITLDLKWRMASER